MAIKRVAGLAVAAIMLSAIGAGASQPDVKLSDLGPDVLYDASNAVTLLMVDPWATSDLYVRQVDGYTTLDVDADPFAVAAR
jgi:hypothetical protein